MRPFTITTPVIAVEDAESAAESGEASDAIDTAPPTATSLYITPEVLPGQVEQPTVVAPTAVIIVPTNADGSSTRVFILPTPTLTFAEQLNPADGCVHSVVRGDTLYQLSLAYATTVEAFFEANQLDSDALSIGQLLLIPDCEPSAPEADRGSATGRATTGAGPARRTAGQWKLQQSPPLKYPRNPRNCCLMGNACISHRPARPGPASPCATTPLWQRFSMPMNSKRAPSFPPGKNS